MKRRLNIRALLILLGVTAAVVVGVHFIHGAQVKRQAGALIAQADRAEQRGDLAGAIDYLRRYLGFRPQDTETLARYGRLLAHEEVATTPAKWQAALNILESVLLREPDRDEERRLAVDLDMRLAPYNGQLYKDAQYHIEHLLKGHPEDAKLLGMLGVCHRERGAYAKAREAFEKAVKADPAEPDHAVGLASLLRDHPESVLRRGKDVKKPETTITLQQLADRIIDDLVLAAPSSPRGYVARAKYRRQYPLPAGTEATLEAAEHDLRKALELAPDDLEGLLTMAGVALDRGATSQAATLLARAKERHPKDWRPYLALARAERGEGRNDAALQHLRDGVKMLPDRLELWWEYADTLVSTGDAKAPDAIEQLKRKGVPQPELDVMSARILLRDHKWADALRLLVHANLRLQGRENLARSPLALASLEQCNRLLALSYEQLGDHHRALAVYLRSPHSLEARFGAARSYAALGKRRESEEQYRKALALPNGQIAQVELARSVLLRNLAQEKPDWDEVKESLRLAEQLRPRPVAVTLLRAEMLSAMGEAKQAREVLEERLQVPGPIPPPPAVYLGMAILEERAGRPGPALAWLDQADERLGKLADVEAARINLWARREGAEAPQALAEVKRGLGQFTADDQARLRRALAVAYTRLNRPDDARGIWQELARDRADDWVARLVLFNQALERNDNAEMDRLLAQLREIENEDGVLWRDATVRRLLRKADDGDRSTLPQARRLTAEIAARWPGWAGVALFEAQIFDISGEHERALERYRYALDRGAAPVQAVRRSLEILYAQQRFGEARALQAKFPRQLEASPQLGRLAAAVSLRASDNADALARAERAVDQGSKDYRDHLFLGQVNWANGRNDKALAAFVKARELAPDAPEASVVLVTFLTATEKKDQARQELEKLAERAKDLKGQLVLAQCYEVVGDKDRAAKIYTSREAVQSGDLSVRRAVATHYLRAGDGPAAQHHLQYLVKSAGPPQSGMKTWAQSMLALLAALRGNYSELKGELAPLEGENKKAGVLERRTRAVLLATRGNARDRREAIALFESLIQDGADTPQDRLMLAQTYETNNDWHRARNELQTLRKLPGGDTAVVLVAYVSAMLRHDEADDVDEALEKLTKLRGQDDLAVLALKAQVMHRRGEAKEAVALLKGYAVKRGQSFGQVAAVLEGLKEFAAAEEMYRRHVEKSPNPTAALAYAGFLGRQKRSREAIELCSKAWGKAPAELVADTCLSILEVAEDDEPLLAGVDKQLQQALSKEPKSVALRVACANLRVLQARYDEAERLYREVIAEDRNNFLARNNLAWLLASREGRAPEAQKLIEEALAAGGPQALLLDTQALVYLAAGKPKEAVKLLEELVRDSPREATYLFHLAQAHAANDNRSAARESLRRAERAGLAPASLHPIEKKGYDRLRKALGQT